MRTTRWILFVTTLLVLLVIVLRNLEETNVELIFARLTMPLAALLTVTLLIGFGLGLLAAPLWKMRNWRTKSKDSKAA